MLLLLLLPAPAALLDLRIIVEESLTNYLRLCCSTALDLGANQSYEA